MCCNFTKLKETENGMIIYMPNCKNYQLNYKNLHFCLTAIELDSFREYLNKINIGYWEKEYENSIYDKKIPIPTLQKNFMILINRFELLELQSLIDFNKKKSGFVDFKDFENKFNIN